MARAYYIDRIRVVLTALVIFHHAAITYGAPGSWYYREIPTTATVSGFLLILFVSVNQAYFMGFFFLIAGVFTPASYNRKSLGQFARDRLVRLGIPLLVFAAILDPLTNAISEAWGQPVARAQPFLRGFWGRVVTADWNAGPLWFAQALLLFSAGYAVWRSWKPREGQTQEEPIPRRSAWVMSALGVGALALLIRQWMPVGKTILGLQLGYFSSYIFLFAVGTMAWHRNWLNRLTWSNARLSITTSIVLLPVMAITALLAGLFGSKSKSPGSLDVTSIVYAFWEPLIAWGVIPAYLLLFRKYGNRPSVHWETLSSCAYAVYVLHAPVLVAVSVSFRPWQAPALVKFALTGSLTALSTFGLSFLVLKAPTVRRVI